MLKNIGKRIKEIRCSKGITQEELAEKTNLSITSISRLENEKSIVSLEKIILISKALNTNLSLILRDYIIPSSQHSAEEMQLIANYRLLDERDKNNVKEIINVFSKNTNNMID